MAKGKIEIDLEKAIKRLIKIGNFQEPNLLLDDKFIANFKACYIILHEAIFDLPVDKQVVITVKSMLIMVRSAKNEVTQLLAGLVKPKILN